MHVTLALILLVAAFVLFVLPVIPAVTPKLELISAGLACATLSVLLGAVQ